MYIVLDKFQEVMCAEVREKDSKFFERDGRLRESDCTQNVWYCCAMGKVLKVNGLI